MRLKSRFILTPPYNRGFWLVWDCDSSKIKRWFKRRGFTFDCNEQWDGGVIEEKDDDQTIWVLWINSKNPQTLVHEVAHMVFWTLRDVGVPITSQEAFCYLLDNIFDKCFKLIFPNVKLE